MGRSRKQQCKVFPADGGFRVIDRISREEAELRVRMEVLAPVFDQLNGTHLGYRIAGADLNQVDADLQSIHTPAAISRREMELNLERSRTRGLSEGRRLERLKNGELPEDQIERVQAKVRVYAAIGSGKGDILRVWPR